MHTSLTEYEHPSEVLAEPLPAVRADDLAAMVIKELLKRNASVPPQQVDDVNSWMCQSSW
jgi:acetyl-CoA acetyltransferase